MSDKLVQVLNCLGTPKILVVGDYMLDRYLWGSVSRVSQEAPVPILKVERDRRDERPGGAGSVAASLEALGARPIAVGIIGADEEGRALRDLLRLRRTQTRGLLVDRGRPTTVKTRMIARAQQMLRIDEEDDSEITPAAAKKLLARCLEALDGVDAVIVQDHGKGVVTRGLMQPLVRACRARRLPLIVDPSPHGDYSKYRGATAMTPNRAETRHATGIEIHNEKAADEAARKLMRDFDLAAAVITLDRDGLAVKERHGKTIMVPAEALEVYDVAGAGDVVAAVVGMGLAANQDIVETARLANVAAGIEVGKIGVGTVTRQEVLARLRGGAESKVKSRADLVTICADLHSRGCTIVFTNGCFDLLHIGHIHLLTQAKKFGDVLVVAINSDASARRVKGPTRPIISEDARAGMLAALACVDYVTIYDEDTPIPLLKLLRPDVIVKGAEYGKKGVVGGDVVESMGGRIENVPMIAGVSTTAVAEKAGKAKQKKQGTRGYVRNN